MLKVLRVTQFVLIDALELELGAGLNVVTGETGAGKSILVNALQLVLGERARSDLVRGGAEECVVEALFDILDDPAASERLAELGIEAEEEVVLRRKVHENGRSYAAINGKLATAAQLRHLATGLVDISSQHEHHSLVDPSTHLAWLDAFGRLGPSAIAMGELQSELLAVDRELSTHEGRLRARTEREDLLRYQGSEIEALAPRPGEDREIEEQAERLRNAWRLRQATGGAEDLLVGRDEALCAQLYRVAGPLRELGRIDPGLEGLAGRIESAAIELEDVARELALATRDLQDDPGRLDEIEERLHALRRLARKYGGSLENAILHRENIKKELSELESGEERLETLRRSRDEALSRAAAHARALSAQRREQASRLGAAISAELSSLGMGGARVHVEVAPLEGRGAELQVEGARLSPTGIDRAEFLIAPNRGEDPRPLRRVASGGELSRSLLALKRVLSGLGPVGLYVFDEVDSGVGGAIAEVIGRKLAEVARHHQVLCITHLPQIAAFADHHYQVRKVLVGDRTQSEIRRLGPEERTEEIARMLGGSTITAATMTAAAEMIALGAGF